MLRIVLEYLVPLVLPTAVYFAVQYWLRRRVAEGHPVPKPSWWDAPWPWLGAAGLVLMLGVLALVSMNEGAPPGAEYHPPELEDGKVQPGSFDK
jgi:hypothetical protein